MAEHDQFNDVKNHTQGIFSADTAALLPALQKHDSVYSKVARDGLVLEFYCDGCGRPTRLEIEWPELVALKYGLNPAQVFRGRQGILSGQAMDWSFDTEEARWKPHAQCRHCEFHFGVRLSPDEPERYLVQGRRSRYINTAGEQQVSQLCAQLAQGGAGP